MKSIFLREQERYSKNALKDLFECNSEKIEKLIKKLKSYGILKLVKNNDNQKDLSDLYNEDIQIIDDYLNESDYLYVFTYVGIIILEEFILKCYPKYISESRNPETEFKMVLKVLEKYNDKKQTVQIYEEYDSKGSLNILSIMIFLLHDYYESGVYNNLIDIFEINGDGEILWDKTINETFTSIVFNLFWKISKLSSFKISKPIFLNLVKIKTLFLLFTSIKKSILSSSYICFSNRSSSPAVKLFSL